MWLVSMSVSQTFIIISFPAGILSPVFLCEALSLQVGQQWKCWPWPAVTSAGNVGRNAREPVFPRPSLAGTHVVMTARAAPAEDSWPVWPEPCSEQHGGLAWVVPGAGETYPRGFHWVRAARANDNSGAISVPRTDLGCVRLASRLCDRNGEYAPGSTGLSGLISDRY